MDFTFLFLVILMLLALQMNQPLIAAGLFIVLLFSSKSRTLLLVGVVGLAVAGLYFSGIGGVNPVFIILGLFVILVISIKTSPPEPGPEAYYPGGMGYT